MYPLSLLENIFEYKFKICSEHFVQECAIISCNLQIHSDCQNWQLVNFDKATISTWVSMKLVICEIFTLGINVAELRIVNLC